MLGEECLYASDRSDPMIYPHVEMSPVLVAQRPIIVVATFDGEVSQVYVDGHAQDRSSLVAAGFLSPMLCDKGVPITSALLAVAMTVVLEISRHHQPIEPGH